MTRPAAPLNRKADRQGFTLVEILIVLGILGILLTLIGSTLTRQTNVQRLRSSATDFAAALTSARSSVFQFNRSATINVAADGESYSVTMNGATSLHPLPEGTRISPASTTITYTAPYSVLTSTPTKLSFTRQGTDQVMVVRTVGILGDVITHAE